MFCWKGYGFQAIYSGTGFRNKGSRARVRVRVRIKSGLLRARVRDRYRDKIAKLYLIYNITSITFL